MENKVININKEYATKQFKDIISPFCDSLIKKNNLIEQLQIELKLCEKNRVDLARIYAKKLGILITRNKWRKLCKTKLSKKT